MTGDYETVAGLMLNLFKRIPGLGDHTDAEGWRFEIIDLDDRRIDKVLVTRLGYQG
jgi:putative hemolysin